MNNRKNTDLKKRLADLRINEPLRLSKPTETVGATDAALRYEVPHSEAPRPSLPKNEGVHKEAARGEITRGRQAQSGSPSGELAQNEANYIEPKIAKLSPTKNAQSGAAQREQAPTEGSRTGLSQNEPAPIEKTYTKSPRLEAAQGERPFDVAQGFFKLSHAIFSHPRLRELSGDCFRLFLWLSCRAWRYPDSDGTVRASVGYMESHIGMGHATVSRGLRSLKETGLVSLEEVNFKRGNLWRITPLALGTFDPENAPPRLKAPQHEPPKNRSEACSKRGAGSLTLSKKPPQSEQQLINFNKQKISEESAMDPAQIEAAIAEFETTLPEETRQNITQKFTAREYPHGIFPPSKVIKTLVAIEWYSQARSAAFAQAG